MPPSPQSTTSKGDFLEVRIRDLLQAEIDADRFWAKKENCKVYWKKGYFSRDRKAEIVFDIAIEIYLPGAKDYSSLVLIECKNYGHRVPVEDAEEFFAKVQQVAAAKAKAVIASTASFQAGTRAFAEAKGLGLMRYFGPENFKWELHRSPSATARSTDPEELSSVDAGLSQDEFRNPSFDLYMQSAVRQTNSLWDFFEDLLGELALTQKEVRRICNARSHLANQVPFLELETLETIGAELLEDFEERHGETDLDAICARESARTGLVVRRRVPVESPGTDLPILGRIRFNPLEIDVYEQGENRGRERFTLAHELAHHFRAAALRNRPVARMEFQANYLAATLLMPRSNVIGEFRDLIRSLEIPDKGFGVLYVDDQPCNLSNYGLVTTHLMNRFGVSRSATKIRLESLGLLRDARGKAKARPIRDILASLVDEC